ncbi:MAG: hypothetical protein HYZ15_02545 [Sphingobacteriales bacterium]|nr:hypothetical protein [Sphingobacteriales bacterium]
MKKELPSLLADAQKVASKHGERHPGLSGIFEKVADLKEEPDSHLEKEEKIFFPGSGKLSHWPGQNKQQGV